MWKSPPVLHFKSIKALITEGKISKKKEEKQGFPRLKEE